MRKKLFRNMILSCLFLLGDPLSIFAQNDAITQYFDQYVENEDFTVVYITPKMFQMIAKLDLKDNDSKEIKDVLQGLRGLRILQTDKNPMQYYKEAIAKFKPNEYALLMTVRSDGDNVRFWTKETNGTINELLMLVGSKTDFVMMSFVGNIDLDKIVKLADGMKVNGAEHLRDLKDKNKRN